MPNYQNIGFVNEGVSKIKYPSFAPQQSNTLMGTNNPMQGVAGGAISAGLNALTGGGSGVLSGVLNLIPSIFQSIIGGRQLSQANKIEANNIRPNAEIAPSVNKLVNYSYGQTVGQDIPGGEMARNEIKGATASGMRAASELGSGAEAYGMLGQLVGREQNAFSDIAKMTAQQVQGAKGQYMDALGMKAQEENRVWDWNKAEPYLEAARIAQQLRDSGTRNLYSGVSNAAGAGAEWAAPDFNSSLLRGKEVGGGSQDIPWDEVNKVLSQFNSNTR